MSPMRSSRHRSRKGNPVSGLHRKSKRVADHLQLAEQLLDRLRTIVNISDGAPEDPWFDLQLARANIDLALAKTKTTKSREEH